jgi:hypothetical protein
VAIYVCKAPTVGASLISGFNVEFHRKGKPIMELAKHKEAAIAFLRAIDKLDAAALANRFAVW